MITKNIGSVKIAEIARVCHEANRVLQIHNGEPVNPPWANTPSEMRRSAYQGVEKVIEGVTPEQLHHNRVNKKLAQGWTYGLVKDEIKKTHPCIVPYYELPGDQTIKDEMFITIVKAMIS